MYPELTYNRLRYCRKMSSFCHICYNSHIPEILKLYILLDLYKGQYPGRYNQHCSHKYNVYCDWYIVRLRRIYAPDKHRSGYMFDHFHDNQVDIYIHMILNYDRIPYLRHFVWVRQPMDADCVISIEYYSKLLNHVSEKEGSWHGVRWLSDQYEMPKAWNLS